MGEQMGAFWGKTGSDVLWPYGPIAIGIVGGFFLLVYWNYRRDFGELRHRLVYRFPFLGHRCRREGILYFSRFLTMLSRTGLTPQTCWNAAAECAPNMSVQKELLTVGQSMTQSSKLSEAIVRSNLFDPEFAPVVTTGEMVGDVPGAIDRYASISQDALEKSTKYSKMRLGCWGCVGTIILTGIGEAILLWTLYHRLPDKILEGFETMVLWFFR